MTRPGVPLLVVLLLAPAMAGCLGARDDVRLAQPTDRPVLLVPEAVEPSTPTSRPPPDFDDPGYVMTKAWRPGDTWRYESAANNDTPARHITLKVESRQETDEGPRYVVLETFGDIGRSHTSNVRSVIDANAWTRIASTDGQGVVVSYDPPAPDLRFLRNGTFQYNESARSPQGLGWDDRHAVNSYFVGYESVQLPWATVMAGRVEHRDLVTRSTGTQDRVLILRWLDDAHGHDVAFQFGEQPRYVLVGFQLDGETRGRIA